MLVAIAGLIGLLVGFFVSTVFLLLVAISPLIAQNAYLWEALENERNRNR